MSLIKNGIFGDPSGSTGGITFGKARTRTGKVATARTKTSPANPNTPAQQTQRSVFSAVQNIVRKLGSAIYRVDWNRSIGQLPGFQAMQSLLMNQMDSLFNLNLDTPINLGTLDEPANLVVSVGDAEMIAVTWDSTVTGVGTADDTIVVLVVGKSATTRETTGSVISMTTAKRSDPNYEISVPVLSAEWELYIYVRGAGVASGLLSVASPHTINLA